jgi:hypothetical protein
MLADASAILARLEKIIGSQAVKIALLEAEIDRLNKLLPHPVKKEPNFKGEKNS